MSQAPTALQIHRGPPYSCEAEQGSLGSMLLSPGDAIAECVERGFSEEYFYVPAHQTLFNVLVDLWNTGHPIDLLTFTQVLRDRNLLESVGGTINGSAGGGAFYVTSLYSFVPTAANLVSYLETVRDKYVLRQVITACTEGVRRAYEEQDEPWLVLDEVQAKVLAVGEDARSADTIKRISTYVPDVIASIKATYHNRGKPIGIPTGFVDLDRSTGGFQSPRSYYIGARPAMGKTSLGTEFAEHVAIENAEAKNPVLIFSVEMTGHEITEVIACRRAGVNLVRLRDGFFSDEALDRLEQEAETLERAPIFIDDTAALSILEFRARSRRAVKKLGIKLIIIDYVQRMKSTSKRAQGNREQEINEIAQGISETAKELKVPIVVLAQLNRKNEERADKTPELSDFRESGSLEQEAHFVGLLHRPAYYCKNDVKLEVEAEKREMTVEAFQELTELIVAKQRRGPVGTINLRFIKQFAQFQSEDEDRPLYSNRPEDHQHKSGSNAAGEISAEELSFDPNKL
jgi:replicative DNA helicase